MDRLKLIALDDEDLDVISAHMQDSVFRTGDLEFTAVDKHFAMMGNRFVWEKASGIFKRSFERRRTVLHFKQVTGVQTRGIDRSRPDDILSLLAVQFLPGDAPGGKIELIFAAEGSIILNVACIEAQLTDIGGVWETKRRPKHPLSN